MNDQTTVDPAQGADHANRREYFRIDDVLPITVQRLVGSASEAKIVPVSMFSAGPHSVGLSLSGHESDSTLTLLLLEMENKLGLLASNGGSAAPPSRDGVDGFVTVKQLLLRLNAALDSLLDAQGIARPDDVMRVSNVSLSGGGIKLEIAGALVAGDYVEVRMLLERGEPVWVVVGGTVIRAMPLPEGGNEVAINFDEMPESVRDTIIHYALRKQKEQILSRG